MNRFREEVSIPRILLFASSMQIRHQQGGKNLPRFQHWNSPSLYLVQQRDFPKLRLRPQSCPVLTQMAASAQRGSGAAGGMACRVGEPRLATQGSRHLLLQLPPELAPFPEKTFM